MAEYKCKNCGATFDEPKINTPAAKQGRGATTLKETEQKCCPKCGAPEDEFGPEEQDDEIGRYD